MLVSDIVKFNVILERTEDGEWEATIKHRPRLIAVHAKPHKAVEMAVKLLAQEGFFKHG